MVDHCERLTIVKLPRAGYAVLKCLGPHDLAEALFASLDIDDALAFIKDEFREPETGEKPHIVTADVTEQVKDKFPPLPERGRYRGIV